jgi:ankyrin repeat protein
VTKPNLIQTITNIFNVNHTKLRAVLTRRSFKCAAIPKQQTKTIQGPSVRSSMCINYNIPTIAGVFAALITRDDPDLLLQFVRLLDEVMVSPKAAASNGLSITLPVDAAEVATTVTSLVNENSRQHKANPASIALVAAAKHGSENVVRALLSESDVEICTVMAVKAHDGALLSGHGAIAQELKRCSVRRDAASGRTMVTNASPRLDFTKTSFAHRPQQALLPPPPPQPSPPLQPSPLSLIDLPASTDALSGVDSPPTGSHLNSMLLAACEHGRTDLVATIMTDADLVLSSGDNQSFILASENGHTAIVQCLLADGRMDPAADKNRAIHWACKNGHPEVVRLLLADPRVDPAVDENDAIQVASASGHAEIVKILLADPRVDPAADENCAVQIASENGHASVVQLLLGDARVDPAVDDNCAIRLASENGHTQVVVALLQDPRVNPTEDDNYAVRFASENGHTDTVAVLLADPRVDPTTDENHAIRVASQFGYTETVQVLLADGRADPGTDEDFAIRYASKKGHADTVAALLRDQRVDPAAQSNFAIRVASKNGHAEVVRLLLSDPRVDPACQNNYAIGLASANGNTAVVELLLADPRVNPAADDNFAIQSACDEGHVDTVKLLLMDARVDPGCENNNPIRAATQHGHFDVVKALLTHPGVDPTAVADELVGLASEYRLAETLIVLMEDPRTNLTADQSRDCVFAAVENGFVDLAEALLARSPLDDAASTDVIRLCAVHGRSEVLKIVLAHWASTDQQQWSTAIYEALELACKGHHSIFARELLTESSHELTAKAVASAVAHDDVLFLRLACLHVDILHTLLNRSSLEGAVRNNLMNMACRMASADVVEELLHHHQDKVDAWTVEDFNAAAMCGNVPVLRLLTLSRYGGCTMLSRTLPLDHTCTRRVFREIHVKSSVMLLWVMKKRHQPATMAKLADVLRDLIASKLLCYDVRK